MHYISIIIVFHFSFYPLTHRILRILLTSSHLVSLVTPTVWSSSAGHSYCFYNASPFKDWDSPRKKKLSERITVEPALSFLVPKSSIKSWDYIKKWRWVDMCPTYCSPSRCSSNMGKKKNTKIPRIYGIDAQKVEMFAKIPVTILPIFTAGFATLLKHRINHLFTGLANDLKLH